MPSSTNGRGESGPSRPALSEDVYTLDRGVTQTLIEKGIQAALIPHNATNRDSTLVARIIQDHYDALDGMFDFVGGRCPLSTSYVKELHAALLRNVETYVGVDQFGHAVEMRLEKGQYKITTNSPTRPDGALHEYCPPEHVASEMDELLRMHGEHENIRPEVEARLAPPPLCTDPSVRGWKWPSGSGACESGVYQGRLVSSDR